MQDLSVPSDAPSPGAIDRVFLTYEVSVGDGEIRYYGTPLVPVREMARELWPIFRDHGYEVRVTRELGEWILVAEPVSLGIDGIPWTNIVLVVATVASTLFAGAAWYHIDVFSPEVAWWELIYAWPFAASIMFVLGVHELGHYVMSRYHRVNASLPFFIPVPTLIGTMGAVIKMKGQIPSRKALFDIGVAGPIAGLIATIVVAIVGLHLPPVTAPEDVMADPNAITVELGYPLLLEFLAWAVGQPLEDPPGTAVNPVVIAAWVGLFVTFLNLIPVGQLDGGHILRAIIGERQAALGSFVPLVLFGLAAYLYTIGGYGLQAVLVWGVWGLLASFLMAVGPAHPIDEGGIGRKRIALGLLTLVLGILCFHPVPLQVHT